MISSMMRGSIKSRVFFSLLFPILIIEILMFAGYYAYIVNVNKLRYEKIAETISIPFISALEEKLRTFQEIEDRKGFLKIYANVKGTIDFEVWKRQYNNISGVSFVDESSIVLVDDGGVENFGLINTGEIRTEIASRTEGYFAIAVPLLVDDYYYGALNFWFPDTEAAKEETIALIAALIGLAVSMVSGVFLAWWISTSITKPINLLATESTHIAAGELDHDISYLASGDEIGLLVKNFHQMRDSIREKISALEEGNLKLVNEVNERKNAERELQKHRDELGVIVEERTANIIAVNQALTESETFLNELINAIPVPIYYKDGDGKYLGFNHAFETISGETKGRLIGKTLFENSPPELAELHNAKDMELFENGGTQQYEAQVEDFSGQLREAIFYKAIYNDSKGKIGGLIGTVLDITERKKLEEQREKLIEELKEALENIKTLRGLIPICSKCKKIRDDKGYWNNLEAFISEHSDASFSHGLCPDCSDELYGNEEWYRALKGKKKK